MKTLKNYFTIVILTMLTVACYQSNQSQQDEAAQDSAAVAATPTVASTSSQKAVKPDPTRQGFITSRDSLVHLLNAISATAEADSPRRLELLNHLYDVSLILGDDSTYLYPLWNESVRQRDVNSMDDIIVPLAMRYQRRGPQDSIDVWMERNERYIPEPRRTQNREYLHLRRDIRNVNEQNELAARIIAEQVQVDPRHEPYRAMRILYSLAVIANLGEGTTPGASLKPSREYKAEALAIARNLPFSESYRFYGQILLGMSTLSADYAREFLAFNQRYLEELGFSHRPFYSRLRIISSLESLIIVGDELPHEELDGYYAQLQQLLRMYPQDTPCAYDQFVSRSNYYYYRAIDNPVECLRWSDSLIAILPKYNLPTQYQKFTRLGLLGRLGQWQEGYRAAVEYIELKDSLNAIGIDKKVAELQTQYDVDRLRLEKEKQQQQLWFAIGGCVLLALLVGFVIYHYYRLRQKNHALYQQYLKQKQSDEMLDKIMAQAPADEMPDKDMQLFMEIRKLLQSEELLADQSIDRNTLAEKLNTNHTYISKAVQTGAGVSVNRYINQVRIDYACSLLKEKDKYTISEIQDRCGFQSRSSFNRAFKDALQMTPSEFQKESGQ